MLVSWPLSLMCLSCNSYICCSPCQNVLSLVWQTIGWIKTFHLPKLRFDIVFGDKCKMAMGLCTGIISPCCTSHKGWISIEICWSEITQRKGITQTFLNLSNISYFGGPTATTEVDTIDKVFYLLHVILKLWLSVCQDLHP